MTEDQTLAHHMEKSMGIAIKIGELIEHQSIGVGVMALQASLKAVLMCASEEDRPAMIAAITMFLIADMSDDESDAEHSVH